MLKFLHKKPRWSLQLFLLIVCSLSTTAQQNMDSLMDAITGPKKALPVTATFKTTRLVNMVTIEQVKRGELDFRISHRFDDIAGDAGGVSTFYGFDNATDIRFAFDYGLNDWWAIGIGRSKGSYLRRQIIDFNTKLKILRQKDDNSMPFSMSAYLQAELCTMASSSDSNSTAYFENSPWHRLNYVGQLMFARKFGERLSLELTPTFVHRNLVNYNENNNTFSLGFGFRYKFTKRFGIILDYYYNFDKFNQPSNGYYFPLGVGFEIETGGHVFHLLFSNNKALLESQYLTACQENWLKGQFRFGFNISRVFNVIK